MTRKEQHLHSCLFCFVQGFDKFRVCVDIGSDFFHAVHLYNKGYRRKDHNGKRKRKWVNTELPEKCSKKALKDAVTVIVEKFEKSIVEGEIAVQAKGSVPLAMPADENVSALPLADFFNDWLIYIKPNVARTTHLSYRKTMDRYMDYINENYPGLTLGQVNHNHIQNFLNYKLNEGCKGSTIRAYYLSLHSVFSYAVKMDLIPKHPMDKLTVPRAERHEATFYNPELPAFFLTQSPKRCNIGTF